MSQIPSRHDRVRRTVTAVGFALAVGFAACSTTVRPPDLGGLYNRNAQEHGPERNPIIVIPGLTGSKLVDSASGRVVWGAFAGDYARPGKPEDARLLALPMAEDVALRDLRDEVYPAGVLEQVKVKVLGLPLKLKAYMDILSALGVGGYRDESFGMSGTIDYGEDHFTCFQFDYDWRRDNVENAQRLKRFIDDKRDYVQAEIFRRYGTVQQEIHFDVVAHSMGGLLLRYFLRYGDADLPADGRLPEVTWAGTRDIDRAVLIAPPNAGSAETLRELVEGRRYGPFIGSYPPALLGTYPAAYQLLPRSDHGALVTLDDPDRPAGDIYSPALWESFGWGLAAADQSPVLEGLLPDVGDAADRRRIALDHQRKSLDRARHFAAALDQPAVPPAGLELFLIAGDAKPTLQTLAVDDRGRLRVIAEGPGDGRVLRSSALMDERVGGSWTPQLQSPIGWTDVMFVFSNHLGITKEPIFTDNLLFWLLEKPRQPVRTPDE